MKKVIEKWAAELKLNKKLLKVSKTAMDAYKKEVRNMEFLPKRLVRKKLSRNVEYVKQVEKTEYEKDGVIVYTYGNMKIFVKNHTIIMVTNRKGKYSSAKFTKNEEVYKKLSVQYLIDK